MKPSNVQSASVPSAFGLKTFSSPDALTVKSPSVPLVLHAPSIEKLTLLLRVFFNLAGSPPAFLAISAPI